MYCFSRLPSSIVLLLALSAQLTSAQAPVTPGGPPAGAPGGGPRAPRPKPTNIKALPKDISGDDLIKLMRQYEEQLGVGCEFCHAQNPATKRNDFPSDANPIKDTARFMIKMTDDINTKYLATLGDRKFADPVNCGTCHRGEAHPSVFVPKPQPPRQPAAAPPAAPPAQ